MNAIIALNPQQMQEAQVTTQGWVDKKLAAAEQELEEADALHGMLTARAMRSDHAKNLMNKAARRVKFYEKCKAALAAGFYIIPPFDIQLFAIRTDRRPAFDMSNRKWSKEAAARDLPLGAGEYRNPEVPRLTAGTRQEKRGDGSTTAVQLYQNGNWLDELDMPVRAMKPTIIEAVGKALELKIFDALGIAPAYRAADPIIAGQIKRPDGKGVLTFFVAWWLDEADLP